MSPDAVYVLVTRGKFPYETEYRVASGNDVNGFFSEYDDTSRSWTPNWNTINRIFGNSRVFYVKEDAMEFAHRKASEYPYLEYGICVLDDFSDLVYNKT